MAKRTTPGVNNSTIRKKTDGSSTDSLVIYIHGIGTKPKPDALKLEWDLALFGRDMGDRTRMAYWADLLHDEFEESTISIRSTDENVNIEGALAAAGMRGEKAHAFGRNVAAIFGVETKGGGGRRQGKKVLPLPSFLRKPISKRFLEVFITDTASYFFKPGMRAKIQDRLQEVLPPAGTPFTLVAHSQGTIISLEVLAKRKTVDVRQFVTIGSPLGIAEVQDFLECDRKVPKSVERWNNFADPLDPVALDKGLSNDFQPSGEIDDELLLNPRSADLGRFNPHSAVGYLSHPKVRAVVHLAVKFDSMSRFVAARDVVARLGTEGRHPVLIEILEPHYKAIGETDNEMYRFESDVECGEVNLSTRINRAAEAIGKMVSDAKAARIDPLRRFVAAHLTACEIREVASRHQTLRVYTIWRSTAKRKLIWRSGKVLQVDAARASYGATGRDITWAVLDTGVQANHPHFTQPNQPSVVTDVWDCTQPGAPKRLPEATDKDGHGTHVAGIIAGGDSGAEYAGLAPEARLVVYKVLDDKGRGEDAWIIKALDHIAQHNESLATIGIHGVNLSLGGPYDSTVYGCGFSPICQELRRQWRSGVLVVVASGNEGQLEVSTPGGDVEINSMMSIGDPANLEDCIAVGSVNTDKPHLYGVSAFSSRGPTSDGRGKPDLVAPGERISSCNARFNQNPSSLYREDSGTSMAAPHVSGLLAAFLSARREFRGRPDEVKRILLDSCTDLGRDRYHQGRGVPNLMKMLLSV
jgi:subtilisin family serine protease